jgi:hypothetical protein
MVFALASIARACASEMGEGTLAMVQLQLPYFCRPDGAFAHSVVADIALKPLYDSVNGCRAFYLIGLSPKALGLLFSKARRQARPTLIDLIEARTRLSGDPLGIGLSFLKSTYELSRTGLGFPQI